MCDEMSPRGRSTNVTDDQLIEAAKTIPDPCFGKAEVAEMVSLGPERARQRLDNLVRADTLDSKKIGTANVYWFKGY